MLPTVRTRTFLPEFTDGFFGRGLLSDFIGGRTDANVPAVNVIENKDAFKIEVAAPGLSKNDFKIDVHNKVLVISSEKQVENNGEDGKYVKREFSYNSFKRSFSLPDEVDTEKIEASHKNGILNISIPKREEAKEKAPRQIKIG